MAHSGTGHTYLRPASGGASWSSARGTRRPRLFLVRLGTGAGTFTRCRFVGRRGGLGGGLAGGETRSRLSCSGGEWARGGGDSERDGDAGEARDEDDGSDDDGSSTGVDADGQRVRVSRDGESAGGSGNSSSPLASSSPTTTVRAYDVDGPTEAANWVRLLLSMGRTGGREGAAEGANAKFKV